MFQDTKLYSDAYDQAVRQNEEAITAIDEFKKELEGVKQTLEENQKHLFQHMMAPLAGGKALIKAKLIRTNEVIVFLGDKWFLRTSAARAIDICNRKIAKCDENKAEIERQTERFCSNIEKAHEYELFSSENLEDIYEPYDEEAEKLWKEKHRERVREFKKQEAAERNRYSDEDFFKKLNKLETEDADLESVEIDEDTDSFSSDDDAPLASENDLIETSNATFQSSQSTQDSNFSSLSDTNKETLKFDVNSLKSHEASNSDPTEMNHIFSSSQNIANSSFEDLNVTAQVLPDCSQNENASQKQNTSKKRVSFSSTDELKCYVPSDSNEDTNIIRFKHSNVKPSSTTYVCNRIESPSDVYHLIAQGFHLKSILKKGTQQFTEEKFQIREPEKVGENLGKKFHSGYESPENHEEIVLGDISEKNPVEISRIEISSRKPSEFRKLKNKLNS